MPNPHSPAAVHACTAPASEVVTRLKKHLQDMNIPLFAEFDHASNALGVNLPLPPTTVLVFGAPAVGTRLMQANPAVALDLPLRVAVWEDKTGKVWLSYPNMQGLGAAYGLDSGPEAEVLQKMAMLLEKLAAACTQ